MSVSSYTCRLLKASSCQRMGLSLTLRYSKLIGSIGGTRLEAARAVAVTLPLSWRRRQPWEGARVWHTAGQRQRGRASSITTTIATRVAATAATATASRRGCYPPQCRLVWGYWSVEHLSKCERLGHIALLSAVVFTGCRSFSNQSSPPPTSLSLVPSWVVLGKSVGWCLGVGNRKEGRDKPQLLTRSSI